MGMYTEFFFRARIKRDAPEQVIDILKSMAEGEAEFKTMENRPDHAFFGTSRGASLFCWYSDYSAHVRSSFERKTRKEEDEDYHSLWTLFVHSELKNYGQEIELFVDWIRPYLDEQCEEFLGYSLYEECVSPRLIYASGGGARLNEIEG